MTYYNLGLIFIDLCVFYCKMNPVPAGVTLQRVAAEEITHTEVILKEHTMVSAPSTGVGWYFRSFSFTCWCQSHCNVTVQIHVCIAAAFNASH